MAKKWAELGRTSRGKDSKRVNLTVRAIGKIPVPVSGRVQIYDTRTAGLGVRVEASGRRSFFWQRKTKDRAKFRRIGLVKDVSIEKARGTADKWNGELAEWRRHGFEDKNPFEGPQRELKFGEVIAGYVNKRVKQHATHPIRAAADVHWMVDKYLSDWKGRKLAAIREKDMRDRHALIAEKHGHTIADRVGQLVRRVFYWATKKEKIFAGPNPASEISFFGDTKRERFLTTDELARLFTALRSEAVSADLRDFVLLSLFCGTRKSDTMSMAWNDLSLNDNCWRIPLPKGGDPYLLPLVPEAIGILRKREKTAKGATYVFPSHGATGHMIEPKRAWRKLLEAAKIEDFTVHDMRRTFGAFQAGLGASLPIIGESLGHKAGSAATSVYARLDLLPVRNSMMAAVSAMLAADQPKKLLNAGS